MAKKIAEKRIRVYPTKDRVGWLINIPGYGRFQPATAEEYLELPAEARKVASTIKGIIIKEVK